MPASASASAPASAPAHAALLRDFANTLDVGKGTDELTSPAALAGWLDDHDLLPAGTAAGGDGGTGTDLADAVALRHGLRAVMAAHHRRDDTAAGPAAMAGLDAIAARLPLRVAFEPSGPRLGPVPGGVPGALAALLAAVISAVADGSWSRLKICPASDCRWSFYDASKNRSRTWCDMQVCGNRQKTRAYRARNRPPA